MKTIALLAVVCLSYTLAAPQTQQEPIAIISQNSNIEPDGAYQYNYETENGFIKGSFSYTSPEDQLIQVQYVADSGGFQPVGDHIPTPPPDPAAI